MVWSLGLTPDHIHHNTNYFLFLKSFSTSCTSLMLRMVFCGSTSSNNLHHKSIWLISLLDLRSEHLFRHAFPFPIASHHIPQFRLTFLQQLQGPGSGSGSRPLALITLIRLVLRSNETRRTRYLFPCTFIIYSFPTFVPVLRDKTQVLSPIEFIYLTGHPARWLGSCSHYLHSTLPNLSN